MSAHRYAYLDGIRGLAAIFVLTRHTSDFWGFSLFRSYLAVDLFFILSGFVIAYAYDRKLAGGEISVRDFALIRLIRLYPMYVLSLFFCTLMIFLGNSFTGRIPGYPLDGIISTLALTALILPSSYAYGDPLFPMNGPYWSLFFELAVNFIYAMVRPLLSTFILILTVTGFGALVAAAAFHHGNLNVGFTWGLFPFASGFARAAFGILYGLLIYRYIDIITGKLDKPYLPWLSISVVVLILISPSAGHFDAVIDAITVIVVFPLCVIFASQKQQTKVTGLLLALGSASYPVYVLHKPFGELLAFIANGLEINLAPYSGIILVLMLIPLTLWLEKIYDIPVRRWLTRKFIRRRSPATQRAAAESGQ